jgi:hypothetical protein
MTLLTALSTLDAHRPTFLRNMPLLVALKASTRVAVVVMVLSQAEKALWLLTLLQAVLGYVAPLTTTKTLHHSELIVLRLL